MDLFYDMRRNVRRNVVFGGFMTVSAKIPTIVEVDSASWIFESSPERITSRCPWNRDQGLEVSHF